MERDHPVDAQLGQLANDLLGLRAFGQRERHRELRLQLRLTFDAAAGFEVQTTAAHIGNDVEAPCTVPVGCRDGLCGAQAAHASEMVAVVALDDEFVVEGIDDDMRSRVGIGCPRGHEGVLLERRLEARENAAVLGCQLFAALLRELSEEVRLLVRQLRRHFDINLHDQITAPAAAQVGNARAFDPEARTRLRARRDMERLRAFERLDFDLRAKRRLRERDAANVHEILTAAHKTRIVFDAHCHVQVAGHPTAGRGGPAWRLTAPYSRVAVKGQIWL